MAIYVGTSGWHYRHWLGPLYPPGTPSRSFLGLYAKLFRTVEINNSFYRLPDKGVLAGWHDTVSGRFLFAVKASRFITHNKKLKDSGDSFRLFFDRVRTLGNRLGPILFQLPPRWNYNGERLREFLASLPPGPSYVFEFRNPDWMREEAYALLEKSGAGFCIHDMPGSRTPVMVLGKLAYVRFHGPEGKYQGSYGDAVLREWAQRMRNWNRKRIQVFAYFNNDAGGFAPKNALSLLAFLKEIA
jgi:uncharacterized protein YecE (DUF72 family)